MKYISTARLTLLGLMMVIGITACSPSRAININPTQMTTLESDFVDFALPICFSTYFSTHVMGYSVKAYSSGVGPSHISWIQSKKDLAGEKQAQTLEKLVIESGYPQTSMKVIQDQPVQVRGQDTTLIISDCVNSEGTTHRQANVSFQGSSGPVFLVHSESMADWRSTTVSTLLAPFHSNRFH
jgi:hypothetical protein